MRSRRRSRFCLVTCLVTAAFLASLVVGDAAIRSANAAFPWFKKGHRHPRGVATCSACAPPVVGEGSWFWMRSPEQERQAVASLYARYCIRCHGVDGRGVWDIPGIPNFADAHWQRTRPDDALTRSIVEGRGAVMPQFRGTLTLEEACAMARYLRTFVPGTELPRPDRLPAALPATAGAEAPSPLHRPAASTSSPGPFAR